ncbi:probable mitochondrial import inner membrane translocase subunit TIM21 [Phoenix dactylifera]|uniref:Mitochondrial import inner membrane translocase subunit Tim21 n=1 Tax=Phoenix dactylifera TaxID=42345 RepID=A0A8B7CE79_PHODC|nr:probable mitochondrial import inner membrane translocase subunit TIM21 [Phoenix dactylifera]
MAARFLNRSKTLTLDRLLHPSSPVYPFPSSQCLRAFLHSIVSLPPFRPPGRGRVPLPDPRSAASGTAPSSPLLPSASPVLDSASSLPNDALARTLGSRKIVEGSGHASCSSSDISRMIKGVTKPEGNSVLFGEHFRWHTINRNPTNLLSKHFGKHSVIPCLGRSSAVSYSTQASEQKTKEEMRKDISTVEDPFDAPTYNIPEKPVTFAEGASYSVIILAGLGVAALAAYGVFKELIFEPKEYKIFGKALERVQKDSQVTVRIGSPVSGYGQESRNRAARQRIPNRVWTDEDGIEHVEVNFYIRGPHGSGKVYAEMFRDHADRKWKFTYLIVEIKSPSHAQLLLESYVPA